MKMHISMDSPLALHTLLYIEPRCFKTLAVNLTLSGIMKLPHCHGKAFAYLVVIMLIMTVMAVKGQGRMCRSTFFSALVQLIPCRTAVSPFGPIPPNEVCCNAIKTLGQPCLCVLVNGPPISGVDRSMALQLPDKCAINFEPCELSRK